MHQASLDAAIREHYGTKAKDNALKFLILLNVSVVAAEAKGIRLSAGSARNSPFVPLIYNCGLYYALTPAAVLVLHCSGGKYANGKPGLTEVEAMVGFQIPTTRE